MTGKSSHLQKNSLNYPKYPKQEREHKRSYAEQVHPLGFYLLLPSHNKPNSPQQAPRTTPEQQARKLDPQIHPLQSPNSHRSCLWHPVQQKRGAVAKVGVSASNGTI
ncbi:hypothetical protein Droror1_Dr00014379 [Drosera rotundifolia]